MRSFVGSHLLAVFVLGHDLSPAKVSGENEQKPQVSPLRYASVEMTNLLSHCGAFIHEDPEHLLATKFVISSKRLACGKLRVK
jgi:hypothetical protein